MNGGSDFLILAFDLPDLGLVLLPGFAIGALPFFDTGFCFVEHAVHLVGYDFGFSLDIETGVFQRAWWWSAIGAGAIVLAAMYMLRLISAVLHEARGSTVADEALDLRPGELALVVPLVGVLLALSAWPAGISHHSFFGPSPAATVKGQFK